MKINTLEIKGLNGSDIPINITFNDDINIITGRNGSGKTTILKLMWYCISGNIERAVSEISFDEISIETTAYHLKVEKSHRESIEFVSYLLTTPQGEVLLDKKGPSDMEKENIVDEVNVKAIELLETSVFFPTFRRIEGGFSIASEQNRRQRMRETPRSVREYIQRESNYSNDIQEALEKHSDRLSVKDHKFVSSTSTNDIEDLVSRERGKATLKVHKVSKDLTKTIIEQIKGYKHVSDSDEFALKLAVSTLDAINLAVTDFELFSEHTFKPYTVLSKTIIRIFEHKGIQLKHGVTLGDIDQSIKADSLSAGEKQMLSFLCYNAFYNDCPFFIDEPELSLHVDWQRTLIDVMVEQKSNNQFFIATHSPFIYTQYEDKEIMMGSNRGDSIEQ